ncbi:hypothetical protein ACHQM5_003055 [Ranunculus cassubicifolius]
MMFLRMLRSYGVPISPNFTDIEGRVLIVPKIVEEPFVVVEESAQDKRGSPVDRMIQVVKVYFKLQIVKWSYIL